MHECIITRKEKIPFTITRFNESVNPSLKSAREALAKHKLHARYEQYKTMVNSILAALPRESKEGTASFSIKEIALKNYDETLPACLSHKERFAKILEYADTMLGKNLANASKYTDTNLRHFMCGIVALSLKTVDKNATMAKLCETLSSETPANKRRKCYNFIGELGMIYLKSVLNANQQMEQHKAKPK